MKWISVKDRLPVEGEQVLQYCPTDYPIINGFKLEAGAPKGISEGFLRSNSTHWMSLPQPPKDK